jgi:phytoene desaturase
MEYQRHILIVGGGLAGLSAGCYLLANGYRTTIIEHGLTLGGVCNAWHHDGYTIDGCIHWLTGGAFAPLYDELGITARVALRPLQEFVTYRDESSGTQAVITSNLDETVRALIALSPTDRAELERLVAGARQMAELRPPIDPPLELSGLGDNLQRFWSLRSGIQELFHFRKPLSVWAEQQLNSPTLRKLFSRLAPAETPTLFLLMILGYLERGHLSRPEGGTAAFRDALVATYRKRGGQTRLHATVDEILVQADRARGVRLTDGEMLEADVVISTSSMPETVLRLLGGRYGADQVRARLENWKLFDPVVLLSYGISLAFPGVPPSLIVDGLDPFQAAGRSIDHLMIRTYNDEPTLAPPGHTVVQVLLGTDYEWWATRGAGYQREKQMLASDVLQRLDAYLPGIREHREIADVATPLTFWRAARSWRGAYEGWIPGSEAFFSHVPKTLPGLANFYMAGQWVEPGGGVPTALMSGRQTAQLVCAAYDRPFSVG